jgi:hypothetical protein
MDGNKWRVLVSKVMNFRVLQYAAEFLDQISNHYLLKTQTLFRAYLLVNN